MEKERLYSSARQLQAPSPEARESYRLKSQMMAEMMHRHFIARPDLERLIGKGNEAMMQDNHENHLRFMYSLFSDYHPEVFTETVLWVFRAYRHHGFQLTYWPAQLNQWVDILKKEMDEDHFREIYPFYHWMIVHNPAFAKLSESEGFDPSSEPAHD
jgi:hypothetical protein